MTLPSFRPHPTDSPDVAREIPTGAFNAVAKTGKIYVESTAHGSDGEFYNIVQRAAAQEKSGGERTTIDFKLHFFAWWMDQEYRLPPYQVALTTDIRAYFEDLRIKHGISLDPEQKAWHAKMLEEQGPDDMKSEYPSTIEECFYTSLEGAYFKREMTKARDDKRIGLPVPYDPSRVVNTFWDIGMDDENCIWFHQTDGVRHRMIEYLPELRRGPATRLEWCRCEKPHAHRRTIGTE